MIDRLNQIEDMYMNGDITWSERRKLQQDVFNSVERRNLKQLNK